MGLFFMSIICDNISRTRKPPISLGNALLDPLRYCGKQWQHIQSKNFSNYGTAALCSVLLAGATVLAFIPGVIGSFVLSCLNKKRPLIENWKISLSPEASLPEVSFKELCKQMNDTNAASRQVIQNIIPYKDVCPISSVGVHRKLVNNEYVTEISLTPSYKNAFFYNIADCFFNRPSSHHAIISLVCMVLGGANSNIAQLSKQLRKLHIPNGEKIRIRIPDHLKHVTVLIPR